MHTNQSASKQLYQYNTLIRLLLDDLKEMLEGPLRDDERQWVLTVMQQVLEYLHAQFELEESSGYLNDILEEFPNWHPQLQHLQQEHRLLHDQFKQILTRLEATTEFSRMSEEFRRHLTDWMTAFRQHQQREADLLHEAFILDVGEGE